MKFSRPDDARMAAEKPARAREFGLPDGFKPPPRLTFIPRWIQAARRLRKERKHVATEKHDRVQTAGTALHRLRHRVVRCARLLECCILVPWFKLAGPPRTLHFTARANAVILRALGATVGRRGVRIHSPITLHGVADDYRHLVIEDGCVLNGNNFLDLTGRITLEEGVSLGPGVTIMTHNRFNCNEFLEERLQHMCGVKDVLIRKGAGIKAGALITMGVTIGENAVVAGSAVVNRDVPPRHFVAGVPARVVREIR